MNKKLLIVTGILVALILAFVGYRQFASTPTPEDLALVAHQTATSKEVGLSFSYPDGEEGFTLVEPPATGGIKKSYILIPTSEYREFEKATGAGETPASISVLVFMLDDEADAEKASTTEQLSRIARLQNWAMDNNTLTSFNLSKATPDIVEIDGVTALHYQADGLYQQDIYLASYKNRVYMFAAQYDTMDDMTITAFPDLVASVSFD